jgi:hypothetical protein
MNIFWAAVVTVGVTAVAVAAILMVRRGAPEGGFFADGDCAAGVFGVLATGFSVLLGFIVFLAFTSYDQSRAGAELRIALLSIGCLVFLGTLVCIATSPISLSM